MTCAIAMRYVCVVRILIELREIVHHQILHRGHFREAVQRVGRSNLNVVQRLGLRCGVRAADDLNPQVLRIGAAH